MQTPDHLFDAAIHARIDPVKGVSESIIIGAPIPLGTGLFQIVADLQHPAPAAAAGAGEAPTAGASLRGAGGQQQRPSSVGDTRLQQLHPAAGAGADAQDPLQLMASLSIGAASVAGAAAALSSARSGRMLFDGLL